MDFLKKVVEEQGAELAGNLVNKLGFNAEQANAFVPEAADAVFDVVKEKAGDLDLSDLASNSDQLAKSIDVGALAEKVGIDPSLVNSGLGALVPTLLSALQEKAGGLSGLMSMLGSKGLGKSLGGVSALGGAAGKLFGK